MSHAVPVAFRALPPYTYAPMVRAGEWLRVLLLVVATCCLWQVRYVATARQYPTFDAGDLFGYFLPAYEYLGERLRAGEIALWNPYQGAGVPMLATLQPGVLYPPRLLLLLLSAPTVLGLLALGHILLGVVAMDRLCRRLGASALGATVGAMVFAASVTFPRINSPPQLEPAAWMPVCGFALVALIETARWRAAIGLGLAIAMPLLAGGYQVAVYVVYALAILGLALLADGRWRPLLLRRAVLVRLAAAGVLAITTALPQALPTLEWSAASSRQLGRLTDEQLFPTYTEMIGWFQTVLPQQVLYRTDPMSNWHLSVPVVALAAVGFLANRLFGLVLGVGTLVAYYVMLGPGSPLFFLYRWLPGLAMFRYPIRMWVIIGFTAAIAAGLATTRLGVAARLPVLRRGVEIALAVVVAVVLVSTGYNPNHYPWTHPPVAAPAFVDTAKRLAGSDRAWLPGDRLDLGFGVYPRHGTRQSLRVLQDYEPLSSRRLGLFLAAVTDRPDFDDDPAQAFTGSIPKVRRIARPYLLDLVSVRAVVTPQTTIDDPAALGWAPVEQAGTLALYENRYALPRAYLTSRVAFVPTEADALAHLIAAGPASRDGVVLVGAPADADAATRTATQATAMAPARVTRDDPEHLTIAIAPERPAVLVIADAFAPGWSARVDGAPRRLWQANHLVRGVEVRPGDRVVELTYDAPGFRLGVGLAVAGWLLVAVIALGERRAPAQ